MLGASLVAQLVKKMWKWKSLGRVRLLIVHGILKARILEWVALSLLQGIFPTQGLNPGLPHCGRIFLPAEPQGKPRNTRVLEWVAHPFSGGSSWPRNRTRVSCTAGGFFTNWAIRESLLKNLPAIQEPLVGSLGREDPLEEGMATHSRILAWGIPMYKGAWRAIVHGVSKSRTRLSD